MKVLGKYMVIKMRGKVKRRTGNCENKKRKLFRTSWNPNYYKDNFLKITQVSHFKNSQLGP